MLTHIDQIDMHLYINAKLMLIDLYIISILLCFILFSQLPLTNSHDTFKVVARSARQTKTDTRTMKYSDRHIQAWH